LSDGPATFTMVESRRSIISAARTIPRMSQRCLFTEVSEVISEE